MKDMLISKQHVRGFALPTILIVSVVMLTILVSAVAAEGTIKTSMDSQYYNQLAREAAESGLARAKSCLASSNYIVQWSNAAPLAPDKNCDGSTISGGNPWVLNSGIVRTTFSVGLPTTGPSGALQTSTSGTVQLMRSAGTNSVWRTYTQTLGETSRYRDTPQIGGGAGWKTRGHIAFMVAQSGALYMWGDNGSNQIGPSSLGTFVTVPTQVVLPAGVTRVAKALTTGEGASAICIIGDNSQAYCRGDGGLGASSDTWVKFVLPAGLSAVDMSVTGYGGDAMCVLSSNQKGYCAGENYYGALGNSVNTWAQVPLSSPVLFNYASPISKINVSATETCAITVAGSNVYCAGFNGWGQLGQGNTTVNGYGVQSTPAKALIPGGLAIADVKMSYHATPDTTVFRTQSGTIYQSGINSYGTMADSSTNGTVYSTPINNSTVGAWDDTIRVGQDGANFYGTCILAPLARVYCTGQNAYGQLGNGTGCTTMSSWTIFALPAGETAMSVAMNGEAGYQMNSVMVMTQSGKVYAAGDNTYGKVGPNQTVGQACNPTPKQIPLPIDPSTGQMVKAVAISNKDEYSAYILGNNGALYALGRNNNGQLGNGTTTDSSTPVIVQIPRQAVVY
jgi:alpha-tubulin suppressor-like RCC1 family protein/Tfp pilus assembly protein PilX